MFWFTRFIRSWASEFIQGPVQSSNLALKITAQSEPYGTILSVPNSLKIAMELEHYSGRTPSICVEIW